jgi:hypothetical protein
MADSRKPFNSAPISYTDILNTSFGVHSSITAGIPANRIVFLNTEARDTNGETITDNVTVGYPATPGFTTFVAGVTKVGSQNTSDAVYLPGFNRDLNVTVTRLGDQFIEVVPGQTFAVGDRIYCDATGRATKVATETATKLIATAPQFGGATGAYVLTTVNLIFN